MKKILLSSMFVLLCASVASGQQFGGTGSLGQQGPGSSSQLGSTLNQGQNQGQLGTSGQFGYSGPSFGAGTQPYGYYGPQQFGTGQQNGVDQFGLAAPQYGTGSSLGYGGTTGLPPYSEQQYGVDQYGSRQYGAGSPFGFGEGTGQPPYGSNLGTQQFGGGFGQGYGTGPGIDPGAGRRFGEFGNSLGPGLNSQQPYGGGAGSSLGGGQYNSGMGSSLGGGGTGQFGGTGGLSGGTGR